MIRKAENEKNQFSLVFVLFVKTLTVGKNTVLALRKGE